MTQLLEQLAALTGLRDRDALDAGLVAAVADLTRARRVAVHRVVGDEGAKRWLTRAQRGEASTVPALVPLWTDSGDQPALDEQPAWRDCLLTGRPRVWRASDSLSLFPLPGQAGQGGVVEVVTERPPTPAQVRGINAVLAVVRNQLGLLDYSERDTLTGLLNRKSFDESFYKAAIQPVQDLLPDGQAERRQTTSPRYWLAVLDIDHFKLVNDNFGHVIGDEVLLIVSQLMCSSFRYYDQLYRFGGEEFVVLLRCATEEDALLAFDRFRSRVAMHNFPQVQRLTLSIGFTDVRPGDTPVAAVERADRAVYYAKNHGRDQVRCLEALIRQGQLADDDKSSEVEFF